MSQSTGVLDARHYWKLNVVPAMSRLRNACKDDATGIYDFMGAEIDEAMTELTDALNDLDSFLDDVEVNLP